MSNFLRSSKAAKMSISSRPQIQGIRSIAEYSSQHAVEESVRLVVVAGARRLVFGSSHASATAKKVLAPSRLGVSMPDLHCSFGSLRRASRLWACITLYSGLIKRHIRIGTQRGQFLLPLQTGLDHHHHEPLRLIRRNRPRLPVHLYGRFLPLRLTYNNVLQHRGNSSRVVIVTPQIPPVTLRCQWATAGNDG